jgi:hypothetical protein
MTNQTREKQTNGRRNRINKEANIILNNFYKITFSWLLAGVKETVDDWGCCFDNEGFIGRAGERDGVIEPALGWCDEGDDWPGKNFDERDEGENCRF